MEAHLDHQLYEQTIEKRPFNPVQDVILLGKIENANRLRGIIELAARILVTPTGETLNEFLAAAKESPEKSFPYAWEIIQFGKQGREDVKAVIDSSLGEELISFVRTALEKEALVAEAYLLDFAAVDVRDGLLLDAIYRTYTELWTSFFGAELPFDQAAMVFLLADAEHEEPAFHPVTVSAWKRALDEHENTTSALGGLGGNPVPKNYSNEPAIFTFWLAVQKERFKKLLEDKSIEGKQQAEHRADPRFDEECAVKKGSCGKSSREESQV